MKALFDKIEELLKPIEGFNWIDIDLGQMSIEKPPVAFPCALYSADADRSVDISEIEELCHVSIEVKIVTDPMGLSTNSKAPKYIKDKAKLHLELADKVWNTLKGYSDENISGIARTSQRTTILETGYVQLSQTYTSTYSQTKE